MPLPLVVAAAQLIFHTLAGSTAGGGYRDAAGIAARFSAPRDVTACRSGDIFVADTGNDVIRKVTAAGVVTTFATGFSQPKGIASDADCNLYVADTLHDVVRRVSSSGVVTTFADGFKQPEDVAFGPDGSLYVADTGNHAIRRVSPSHEVTTFAEGLQAPTSIAVDGAGIAYVADRAAFAIFRISAGAVQNVSSPATIGAASLAVAEDGSVLVADSDNGVIRRLAAGLPIVAGIPGSLDHEDGPAASARFRGPSGIWPGANGKMIVSETGNQTIRVIENGDVRTLAGSAPEPGSADGSGDIARFRFPTGVTVDRNGTVYVADQNGIRKISPSGSVTTMAKRGTFSISFPVVDANGNVYTSSFFEHVIYKITPDGTSAIFAGTPGAAGLVNARGGAARFQNPRGLAVGSDGSIYVGDAGNRAIRKITPAGDVTTVKTEMGAVLNLIIDGDDTIYFISESNPAPIRRLTRDGTLTLLASFDDYTSLHEPRIARAPDGTFYTIDVNTSAVRRVLATGTEIAAGVDQGPGNQDGAGTDARFDLPREIAFGPDGRLYLSDAGSHAIRVAEFGEALKIASFTSQPPRIPPGGSVTLQWQTTGARSARIAPSVGDVPVNGAITLTPAHSTTYTLTVTGDSGEVSASVFVAVGDPPPRRRAVQ